MIERYSIDSLADVIRNELMTADPDPKLVRRFFRKGKRDGKRKRDARSPEEYIAQAVEIAASKITEDYVREAQDLANEIRALQARRDVLVRALSNGGYGSSGPMSRPAAGSPAKKAAADARVRPARKRATKSVSAKAKSAAKRATP